MIDAMIAPALAEYLGPFSRTRVMHSSTMAATYDCRRVPGRVWMVMSAERRAAMARRTSRAFGACESSLELKISYLRASQRGVLH